MSILSDELQLAKYDGLSDTDCLALLTTKDIPVKQSITNQDIKNYLVAVGKLRGIKEGTTDSAKDAWLALNEIPIFDMANPAYEASLTANIDDLVTDNLLNESDKVYILAMGDKFISRVDEINLSDYHLGYIAKARLL